MKRMPIGLTEEQHQRLRTEATRRRTTVAALVRNAVDEVYPADAERRRQAHIRSLEVVGKFHSGKTDISERHDDYLAEAYLADLKKR